MKSLREIAEDGRGWVSAVIYLLFIGLFYLIFAYAADFSVRQSIVLALFFLWLLWAIESHALEPTQRFSPYWIRADPKWYQLLTDFKLIGEAEEWRVILESFDELPSADYRVLRNGICFTVAQQSEDLERTLIYSDNHRAFVSKVDFWELMTPIKLRREAQFSELQAYDVRFFMKFGGAGYSLGIQVPDWWWDEMKPLCPKPVDQGTDYATGRVTLTLATISHREFDLYWEPAKWNYKFYTKTAVQIGERREEQRKRFEWKTIEHEEIPELRIDWPESIEHKYFHVTHRRI